MTQKEPTTSYSKPILGLLRLPFWSLGTHFSPPKGTCWSQETPLGVLLAVRYSLWSSQGSLGALPETLGSYLGGPSGPSGSSKTHVFLKENNAFRKNTFSIKLSDQEGHMISGRSLWTLRIFKNLCFPRGKQRIPKKHLFEKFSDQEGHMTQNEVPLDPRDLQKPMFSLRKTSNFKKSPFRES